MLSVQAAETLIQSLAYPLDPEQDQETIPLLQAPGRILAQAITSDLDFPYWHNSAMDGYGVRHQDLAKVGEGTIELEIIEEIAAGQVPQRTLGPGQAVRIFTGAMVPQGADTIVMQENTQPIPATATNPIPRVAILQVPEPQAFVRRQGAYYQAGTPLLNPGIALSAPDIAVLAAMQCAQASVYRRLRVAIFSTGDELVSIDQPLQPGQIVDSNQYALATLVQQMGAEPILLGIVPDDSQALKAAMTHAIQQADVVLSSGGVSVGDYDYVDQLLKDLGATLHIRSIAVKPGKPLTVATVPPGGDVQIDRPVLYFGLPGNPVSALVSFWRFVQPALKKMAGLSQGYGAEFIEGITQQDLRAGGTRETYLWGHCHWHQDGHHDEQNGACQFSLAGGSHSSGNLINLAQTNALAMVPVGTKLVRAGDRVKILRV